MTAKMVWLLAVACWSGIDFSLGEMLLRVTDYNIKFLSVEALLQSLSENSDLRLSSNNSSPIFWRCRKSKTGRLSNNSSTQMNGRS